MTKVNLHGILKYEFGEVKPLYISRPKEVVDAIDCFKKNFKARIYQLAREGTHFNIIADGESIKNLNQFQMKKNFKQIDIVPIVAGGIDPISIIINIAIIIISTAIQLALTKSTTTTSEQIESEVSSNAESFSIASATNVTEQGNPVPVGYGRLRVGSYIIQASVKSYPQTQTSSEVLKEPNTDSQVVTSQIAVSS